jgi:hypothetical protein
MEKSPNGLAFDLGKPGKAFVIFLLCIIALGRLFLV